MQHPIYCAEKFVSNVYKCTEDKKSITVWRVMSIYFVFNSKINAVLLIPQQYIYNRTRQSLKLANLTLNLPLFSNCNLLKRLMNQKVNFKLFVPTQQKLEKSKMMVIPRAYVAI